MRDLYTTAPSRPPRAPSSVVQTDVRFVPAFENARRELFLRGTEVAELRMPATPPLAQARIRYPGRGKRAGHRSGHSAADPARVLRRRPARLAAAAGTERPVGMA
ncbi:MAG: hypothetical protein MZV65_37485 [Chromatiales bacterium]|nr:hypothetical protein [Chromatiales bacterium]